MKFSGRPLRVIAFAGLAVFASATLAFSQEEDEDEAPDRAVTLDAATIARLSIATAPTMAAEYHEETNGFGIVIGFDALAQTDADLATAEAAVDASKAALARARSLFDANTSVSRQTVEAAERQAAADAAQLALAQRRSVTAWGPNVPWRNAAQRSALLMRLAAGELAFARVTFPGGAMIDTAPSSLKFERVNAGQSAKGWTATTIWNAPGDPTIPGRSFFALVQNARELLPGERLLVYLPTGPVQQGSIIPSSALILAEGAAWYYVAETVALIIPMAPLEDFTRHMLDISRPTPEGYFVPGATPGQRVVVDGAGLLLAKEMGVEEEED
jgi:hypothetical protein